MSATQTARLTSVGAPTDLLTTPTKSNPDPFEVLTLEEVAARLKFTRRQLYELTRRRGMSLDHPPLPSFKINGNIRVLRSDLETWLLALAAKGRTQ
jgi:Helix-turn-helix domain